MSIEGDPGSPNKKPRFSLVKCMIGIGLFANQGLYGTSDALAARQLNDRGLEQLSLTRAGIGFVVAAAGVWYVRRHYHNNPQPLRLEAAPEIEKPLIPEQVTPDQAPDGAEVIALPPPMEVGNPTEEAA